MNISHFKVYHLNNACLGIATMRDNRISYKTDSKAYAWFEARPDAWLREFRKEVVRMCREVGHGGTFACLDNPESGIRVERI